MEQQTTLRTFPKSERNLYLAGIGGQGVIFGIMNMLLTSYYLQNVLYIPAIVVSVILSAARVWDAINDVIMGTIVDRTQTKWGKCKSYLMLAPVPVGITTILCFTNYQYNENLGMFAGRNAFIIIWAGAMYVMWDLFYTIGDIPLWGIGALMTESEKDRQKLVSLARIVGGIAGAVMMLALQPLALMATDFFSEKYDFYTAQQYGFMFVGISITVVCTIFFQLAGVSAKERITAPKEERKTRQSFRLLWSNKPFRQVLISGVLASPKAVMQMVAMPIVTYYYANKDAGLVLVYLGLLGGGLFAGQFVITALMPRLVNRTSKKKLYNWGNLIVVPPNILLFLLYLSAPDKMTQPFYLALSFLAFVINGVSLGSTLVLQTYMVADAIDYEEYHNGRRPDGLFFSGLTFIAKISNGSGQILYGIACAAVGFSDANIKWLDGFIDGGGMVREAMLTNPDIKSYMTMLFAMITIPAAISGFLAVLPTWKYALDDKEYKTLLAELNRRRHESDEAATEELS